MTQESKTVAVVGNPTSDKGRGAKIDAQVIDLLETAGSQYGFDVVDLTGTSFDDSLARVRDAAGSYDYLVVIGGDGMIALGANAVGNSGTPLGIVAIGSGNDFARGLKLPIDRVEVAVDGIVGAIVRGSHIDVDMGYVVSLPGGWAVDPTTGDELPADCPPDDQPTGDLPVVDMPEGSDSGDANKAHAFKPINRFYAGMLSCGLDASINDRANRSHLPNGKLRYLSAVLVELTHMKRYGYHVKAVLADGSVDERDIISPMLTVANSRHIGGGLEVSPYSRFADDLLDLVWLDHMPNPRECAEAISKAYGDRLLSCRCFGWQRVRSVEITRADQGDEPPVFMADGEYVGHLPVSVTAEGHALRVLVPPAVALEERNRSEEKIDDLIARDGRDVRTGVFLSQ